jgi:hypothetical protein
MSRIESESTQQQDKPYLHDKSSAICEEKDNVRHYLSSSLGWFSRNVFITFQPEAKAASAARITRAFITRTTEYRDGSGAPVESPIKVRRTIATQKNAKITIADLLAILFFTISPPFSFCKIR